MVGKVDRIVEDLFKGGLVWNGLDASTMNSPICRDDRQNALCMKYDGGEGR